MKKSLVRHSETIWTNSTKTNILYIGKSYLFFTRLQTINRTQAKMAWQISLVSRIYSQKKGLRADLVSNESKKAKKLCTEYDSALTDTARSHWFEREERKIGVHISQCGKDENADGRNSRRTVPLFRDPGCVCSICHYSTKSLHRLRAE